ncbi:phage tail protein [Bradyrhizobium sp. CCGB01]|uniref:phage tail protein n=1 Tax=Bradyrhizobium sp. CCGB01 TaxID=2949634 RepID=UPI0020B29E38|nr:tail fiber protein [Bradyrhizobium sp. CCGB01]MCP3411522.1 tail fiber protein [Bradyrhizobium sp. CCGB01]
MPLESATFISDLVISNPAASDPLAGADDHLRLIKATLKNTFQNVSGQVTATHTDLNNAAAFLAGTKIANVPLGSAALPSYTFLGDFNTGLYSPGAGQLGLSVGGVQALGIAADKSATFAGPLSAPVLTGAGVVPIGGMVMWLSDTLPTVGQWCWANGGTLSRNGNGAALFALWGTTYGVGDGSTTFNVPNMQEAVPVGKSTMGGAASPGLLASIASGLKGALGGLFGTDTTTLTASQIPAITSNGSMTGPASGSISGSASNVILGGTSGGGGVGGGGNFGLSGNAGVSGSFSGSASVSGSVTSNNTGGGAHSNLQPSRTVNFIIRIG